MSEFAAGKKAIAECDICGFRYKLKQLRALVVNDQEVNLLACPTCWDEDHPQLKHGKYPVRDPQALRSPRPDYAGYAQSRSLTVELGSVFSKTHAGQLTVT